MGSKKTKKGDDFLNERVRAEDILLGALGFDESAMICEVLPTPAGYRGVGKYKDGEEFAFESDIPPTPLESWALSVLQKQAQAS